MSDDSDNQNSFSSPPSSVGSDSSTSESLPEYFPTSARPVFLKIGILIVGLIALCVAVYVTSTHEEEPTTLKNERSREMLSEDEE